MAEAPECAAAALPRRLPPWTLFALGPACAVLGRTVLFFTEGIDDELDALGLWSDVVVGGCVGLGLVGLRCVPRLGVPLAAAAAAGWAAACLLAAEHVRALGVWPDAAHVGVLTEPAFVRGSLLRPTHAVLLAPACVIAAVVAWRAPRLGHSGPARVARPLGLAALGLLSLWLTPSPREADRWRTTGFVSENVSNLYATTVGADPLAVADPASPGAVAAAAVADAWRRADLSGERIPGLPLTDPPPNVLLLVLEGLGGDRFVPVAGELPKLPRLSALAAEHHFVPRFINTAAMTNRGTHALLTGAMPQVRLGTPRMSVYADLPPGPSLPSALRARGYRTAYDQSAALAFMAKGPYLRAIGFEEVTDAQGVEGATEASRWGMDDRLLMRRTLKRIDFLEAEPTDAPWFLTVLTVGTHHPFIVPGGFDRRPGESDRARSFRYADAAVGELVDGLAVRGLLETTLVVVTSDETSSGDGSLKMPADLRAQWGFTLCLVPGGGPWVHPGLFGQGDVPLSILDAVGAADGVGGSGLPGRSFFRVYGTPRSMPFATPYGRRAGVFFGDGSVEVLGPGFEPHRAYAPNPDASGEEAARGFHRLVRTGPGAQTGRALPLLAALAAAQDRELAPRVGGRVTVLPPGVYPLRAVTAGGDGLTALTEHQVFSLPAGRSARLVAELRTDPAADVEEIQIDDGGRVRRFEHDGAGLWTLDTLVSSHRSTREDVLLDAHARVAGGAAADVQVERFELILPWAFGDPP